MSASLAERSPSQPGEFTFNQADFRRIADVIHDDAGIYLSDEKMPLAYSRLAKRLRALGLSSFQEYCELVESKDGFAERRNMLAALTTNVTHFFREPHHFEHLKSVVLPAYLPELKKGGSLRIWSAACSNGQEPYSAAMTILNAIPEASSLDIKILATDIDPNMVAQGREGKYPERLFETVSKEYTSKYFDKSKSGTEVTYTAKPALKNMVVFRELNLIADRWPMRGKFHAIFCRNVAIYFKAETQQKVWHRFTEYMAPQSWLYIGHSERITGLASDLLTGDGITTYRRK